MDTTDTRRFMAPTALDTLRDLLHTRFATEPDWLMAGYEAAADLSIAAGDGLSYWTGGASRSRAKGGLVIDAFGDSHDADSIRRAAFELLVLADLAEIQLSTIASESNTGGITADGL